MKWFILSLFVLGVALAGWGTTITNGPGSADERVAGAFPILFGVGFIVLDVVVALVWLIFRA